MPTDIQQACEVVEQCYEYTLSYAAQGHAGEAGSAADRQLRDHLARALAALGGLGAASSVAAGAGQLGERTAAQAFAEVLAADARQAMAAIGLVLAQPAIGSQMIDSLNASIHVRALLADLFLVTEVLEAREAARVAAS